MPPRSAPITPIAERPAPGPLRRFLDVWHAVFGKVVSFADVLLLYSATGVTVTNAAVAPGTALTHTRVLVNFADTGADQVRLVARAENSTAGSVTLQLYDVTNARVLCTVTVTGVAPATVVGAYAPTKPTGNEHELELRVIGDGAMDPILYRASAQLRTTQARA